MPNKISPESSDGLFRTPLELFSLEREGRPVAGRPFHHYGRFATNRFTFFYEPRPFLLLMLLMQAARLHRPRGLRPWAKFVATLHTALPCTTALPTSLWRPATSSSDRRQSACRGNAH